MYIITKHTHTHYLISIEDNSLISGNFSSILIPCSEIEAVIENIIAKTEENFKKDIIA